MLLTIRSSFAMVLWSGKRTVSIFRATKLKVLTDSKLSSEEINLYLHDVFIEIIIMYAILGDFQEKLQICGKIIMQFNGKINITLCSTWAARPSMENLSLKIFCSLGHLLTSFLLIILQIFFVFSFPLSRTCSILPTLWCFACSTVNHSFELSK